MSPTEAIIPDHVPRHLVRDFDYFDLPGMRADVHGAWKRVQDANPDIFWTTRYGGMWVATRADDIERMQKEHEIFSMTVQAIPPNLSPNLPMELDPPEHGPIRAVLNPLFSPRVVRDLTDVARAAAIALIEHYQPLGRCEFIADFGRQLPISLFLRLVDLPESDRDMLLELTEIRVRGNNAEVREGAKRRLLDYLAAVIGARMVHPSGDVLSKIVTAKVKGEPIAMETAQNLLSVVMFGGLDTVATMMGFAARQLALDPGLRHRLADDPALIPAAINEIIRKHGLTTGGRLIMRDIDYKGVPMRKGDRVMVPTPMAGMDERRFPNPDRIDLDRDNALDTMTFGNGAHRCPGSTLAKAEMQVFLEEWLKRIPDFALDPDDPPVMASGFVSGILRLPLIWH